MVSGNNPETIWKQFIRDIQAIQNLEELKWVFHKTSGVNKDNLKEKIISTLKKPDGTPVDEIKNLFAKRKAHTKIQEIFGQTTTTPEKLLDKLNSNNIFDEVFIVID